MQNYGILLASKPSRVGPCALKVWPFQITETLAGKSMSVFWFFIKGVKQKMGRKGAAGFMITAVQKHVQERITIAAHEVWHEVTHKYDMR